MPSRLSQRGLIITPLSLSLLNYCSPHPPCPADCPAWDHVIQLFVCCADPDTGQLPPSCDPCQRTVWVGEAGPGPATAGAAVPLQQGRGAGSSSRRYGRLGPGGAVAEEPLLCGREMARWITPFRQVMPITCGCISRHMQGQLALPLSAASYPSHLRARIPRRFLPGPAWGLGFKGCAVKAVGPPTSPCIPALPPVQAPCGAVADRCHPHAPPPHLPHLYLDHAIHGLGGPLGALPPTAPLPSARCPGKRGWCS